MRPAYGHTDTDNDSLSICPGTYAKNPETVEIKDFASEDVREYKQGNEQGSIPGGSPY